jgi:hypothetical protein
MVRTLGHAAPEAARVAAPVAAGAVPGGEAFRLPDAVVGDPSECRVEPRLAVLYRLAVGPAADFYTPRFLRYEQEGHARPGFHWAALMLPPVWAFYRKLWVAGVVYALMPILGALAVHALGEHIDDWNVPWLAGAVLLVWLVPSLAAATLANSLLYRRIRRLVRRAEARSDTAAQAAQLLSERSPTSGAAGFLLGVGSIALALGLVTPGIFRAYAEHDARAKVAETLASVKDVQEKVVDQIQRSGGAAAGAGHGEVHLATGWTHKLQALSLNPATGRLRLSLGPAVPELWGKTLVLAPALDVFQRVVWYCVPIDIPARFLPKECR